MNKQMIAPCPFCSVKAYAIDQIVRQIVECGGCGVEMEGLDLEDAVRRWNHRTPAEPRLADGEMTEKVARAIWNTSQDHVIGEPGTYALKMRMSWDEARRAARAAITAYNPDVRLREALERARRGIAALEVGAMPFRDDYIARIDEALSPLSQGED